MKMKKLNVFAVALFVTAFALGSFMVGGGVQAQTAGDVECLPATSTVVLGSAVTLTATGGDGEYVWSSPGLVISNPTGDNFVATFNAAGDYTVSVSSDGESDTCAIAVTATEAPAPGIPAPGLPNTGELYVK
jgi:hypothetical protein